MPRYRDPWNISIGGNRVVELNGRALARLPGSALGESTVVLCYRFLSHKHFISGLAAILGIAYVETLLYGKDVYRQRDLDLRRIEQASRLCPAVAAFSIVIHGPISFQQRVNHIWLTVADDQLKITSAMASLYLLCVLSLLISPFKLLGLERRTAAIHGG